MTLRSPYRLLTLVASALVLFAACGGPSPENVFEAAANAAGADVDDIEFDDDDGTFSAQLGDADVAFGGGRPDWLEPQFVLPEGLEVQLAVDDPSTGERAIQGFVEAGSVDAIAAQQLAAMTAAGYERLGDSNIFVASGQHPIEIQAEEIGTGVYFALLHRFEDEQTLRDIYSPIEGLSEAAVTIGDLRYLFEGECTLRSDGGQFTMPNGALGEPTGDVSVERRDGAQQYILANFTTVNGDEFGQWTILQQDADGNYPQLRIDPAGFNVTGFVQNLTDGTTEPVVIAVACMG